MAITKINYQVTEEQNFQNYINVIRSGQSISDIGWTTYSDSAGVNPVDGSGGTASITWGQNVSNPLSGSFDFRLVKDASNRQGNGVSVPFTITNRHLAKVLQISFDTELISGNYENPIITPISGTYSITSTTCTVTASHSFVQGQSVFMTFTSGSPPTNGFYTITSVTATTFVFTVSSGSSTGNCNYTTIGDIRISIIQDPTGTPVVIEPVNTNLQLGIANQRIKHIASFQTHISITSYLLCIHIGSASTVAYTVDFNNFKIWEPTQSVGSVITDWQSYTPTLISFGTTTNQDFQWRRVGGNMEIQGKWTAGTSTATEARLPLPFGTVDSARVPSIRIVGTGGYNASATTYFGTYVLAEPSVSYLTMSIQSSTANALTKVNGSTMGNNTYTIYASVPITGWGSSVAMSSDTGDGRVVAAKYTSLTSATVSNTIPLRWTVKEYDTHNAVSIGTSGSSSDTWKFTAPVSGYYCISGVASTTASTNLNLFKNGISIHGLFYTQTAGNYDNFKSTIYLNSGDYIDVRHASSSFTASGQSLGFVSIERISTGNQQIGTSETVACEVWTNANTTATTTANFIFNQIVRDTHGAWNTSSGIYTAPMSGWYSLTIMINPSTGAAVNIDLYKASVGGSFAKYKMISQHTATNYPISSIGSFYLLAGEQISVRSSASYTAFGTTTLAANSSWLSVNRVGV